jgi:hypothetical protein
MYFEQASEKKLGMKCLLANFYPDFLFFYFIFSKEIKNLLGTAV